MTEEQVTKAILGWLLEEGWEIVCYDFPQSGTGVFLHPNGSTEKNKDTINPDIVAVKNGICVFFENKSYFYYPDFEKVDMLRNTSDYSDAIGNLLRNYQINSIKYGIGYPSSVHKKKVKESVNMTDFIIGVSEGREIEFLYIVDDNIF